MTPPGAHPAKASCSQTRNRHLSSETRDIIKLGMGLVSTTVAVVLGLLIASAISFYDTQTAEVTQLAANVILLDRMLSYYGPETTGARSTLSEVLANLVASEDSEPGSKNIYTEIKAGTRGGEVVVRGSAARRHAAAWTLAYQADALPYPPSPINLPRPQHDYDRRHRTMGTRTSRRAPRNGTHSFTGTWPTFGDLKIAVVGQRLSGIFAVLG